MAKNAHAEIEKQCPKCGEVKAVGEFAWKNRNRGEIQWECKQCKIEYAAAYRKANPGKIAAKDRAYRAANLEKIAAQKKAKKAANIAYLASIRPLQCEVCGYDRCISALDSHHTDPTQKENSRDSMGRWLCLKFETCKVKLQANHFQILCKNCHVELHSNDRGRGDG